MGAMRSASEQQLLISHARLGDDAVGRPNSATDPSMESLMTLLWATKVIDRERQRLEDAMSVEPLDNTVTQVERACEELDGLFRLRSVRKRELHSSAYAWDEPEIQKSKLNGDGEWSFGV